MAKQPIYKSLYFQVIIAIIAGILVGHYSPSGTQIINGVEQYVPGLGEQLKPLGDGFIRLIKMIIAIIIFIIVLFLGGCASERIVYQAVEVEKIQLKTNEIQQLNLKQIDLYINKVDNQNYICYKSESSQDVVDNFQQMKNYIKQQKDVIDYYESQIKERQLQE